MKKKRLQQITDILQQRTENEPDRSPYIFLGDGDTESARLNYRDLNAKALAIAGRLNSLDAAGKRVLLLYPAGLALIPAFFGCLYANAIAALLRLPRKAHDIPWLQAVADDSQASVVLTTAEWLPRVQTWFRDSIDNGRFQLVATDGTAWERMEIAPVYSAD